MKTNRIIQLAAGVLLLTACTSDFYEEYVNGRVPVNLGYEVLTAEESTRTAASTTLNDANIASGDAITVKIKNNGAATSAYTSYTYTAGASGAMTPPSPKPYYPTGSTNIDILAYYPSTAGNSSNFDVQADQTTDANYKASDLMVATVTNQAKTTSTVALAFQHKMAKLVVTATKGDGVNKIQTITLKNVKRRVSFTNTSGAVGSATTISGSTDVTLFKSGTGTSGTGAALIPAQTITGDVIAIETDQGTAVYNVPAGKAFAANTKYTISVTVNRTAVGAVNSITWGSSASLTIQPTVEAVLPDRTPAGVNAVDLGLYVGGADSGKKLLWADRNIGATSVTDYGLYFAWGDVIGRSGAVSSGTTAADGYSFSWTNTPYNYGSSNFSATKYTSTDGKTKLENCDDAAYMNWGGKWRMPTKAEMDKLAALTNAWTTDYNGSGVAGRTFTGNGNTIFLPAAGYRYDSSVFGQGSDGCYWSSTTGGNPSRAWSLYFISSNASVSGNYRYGGDSVRAVCEE